MAYLSIRSFLVRAILERREPRGPAAWRGYVTDVSTGERQIWTDLEQATRFLDRQLDLATADERPAEDPFSEDRPADETTAAETSDEEPADDAGSAMTAPVLSDVLTDMLSRLNDPLLGSGSDPGLEPTITIDRVSEKLVGLGGLRGIEQLSNLGPQVLKGGRLDARVRFELRDSTAALVDNAILDLQGRLLDASTTLRANGFLKFSAAETSPAEHEPTVGDWQKVTAYDVLYEYQYRDADGALSLVTRIPVDADPEIADSPNRETSVVTDQLVRWDDEGAVDLTAVGPSTVGSLQLLAFIPGPNPGGTITLLRTEDGAAGDPIEHANLVGFLAAVSGEAPAESHASLTLDWPTFAAAFTPDEGTIELLNDVDGIDVYEPSQLDIDPSIRLPTADDRFEITYSDSGGLDQPAVLYLRINAP